MPACSPFISRNTLSSPHMYPNFLTSHPIFFQRSNLFFKQCAISFTQYALFAQFSWFRIKLPYFQKKEGVLNLSNQQMKSFSQTKCPFFLDTTPYFPHTVPYFSHKHHVLHTSWTIFTQKSLSSKFHAQFILHTTCSIFYGVHRIFFKLCALFLTYRVHNFTQNVLSFDTRHFILFHNMPYCSRQGAPFPFDTHQWFT